jgi:hypothetical protein
MATMGRLSDLFTVLELASSNGHDPALPQGRVMGTTVPIENQV